MIVLQWEEQGLSRVHLGILSRRQFDASEHSLRGSPVAASLAWLIDDFRGSWVDLERSAWLEQMAACLAVAAAAHEVGALFVLDCIASGAMWVDMQATGVDVLISAPQKGWSGSPCCAMVMLSERARQAIDGTTSSSFACDLKKWMQIAEGYEKGQHAYHTTMPTDALVRLRDVMQETREYGFAKVRQEQIELGAQVRALLESKGFPSVAAEGWKAPGVVVSYTTDPGIQNASKFAAVGLQTASGVPLQCDEGPDFKSFRIGLFGLEKWHNVERTVGHLRTALDRIA